MTYLTQHAHQVIALVLAVVITAGIQGSLLAGFEQMAVRRPHPWWWPVASSSAGHMPMGPMRNSRFL